MRSPREFIVREGGYTLGMRDLTQRVEEEKLSTESRRSSREGGLRTSRLQHVVEGWRKKCSQID